MAGALALWEWTFSRASITPTADHRPPPWTGRRPPTRRNALTSKYERLTIHCTLLAYQLPDGAKSCPGEFFCSSNEFDSAKS